MVGDAKVNLLVKIQTSKVFTWSLFKKKIDFQF